MLSEGLSASRRVLFLAAILGVTILTVCGCAGVVSPSGATGNPTSGDLAISNVQASGATNSSVQLSWATNQPATSAIDYGTTSTYGASTPMSGSMVTAHQMALTGLARSTTYHFRVRSTAGGNSASSPDQTFSTTGGSNNAPSVQITSPVPGATLSGTVNLTAVASDNGSISGVQFLVDGTVVGPSLAVPPYLYVLNSSTLSNGTHSISAVATDNKGNSTTSANVSVTVNNATKDTTPPTVSIVAPAASTTISGTVNVTAIASDNIGVASVQFQLDGTNVGGLDAATPYIFTWDTTKAANGAHQLDAIAKDGAGNTTTSAVVAINVNNTSAKNFSITGTISGTGGNDATVALTGTSSATTTANAAGVYSFTGLAAGSYTVKASHTGFTFSPASLAETISTANITGANFAATAVAPQTFSITGTISGTGGNGATVALTGASSATATANGAGVYSFTGLAAGSYTVKASHTGFTFSPASLAEAISTANITGANFTATAVAPKTFSITGTISGSGGNGATVTLSGSAVAATSANASGVYTFTGLAAGNYTVTPSHTGFTFSPTSLAKTISTANITGANFTATAVAPQTFSISGTITGTGGNGATVVLSGAASATTTANGSGAYTFTGLGAGGYAVTPSHTGFTFSPTSLAETITTANITGANFTATAVTPQTFSISGTISSAGGKNATVILSGAAGMTTTANASGVYTFSALANGIYSVTPSNSGFTFSPSSQNVTVNGASKTGVNFTSTTDTPASVTLSWSASTSSVVGYNVYRSTTPNMGFTKLNSSLITKTSFDDTTVQSGTTYYYVATSVDSAGNESANSNQATATVP